MDGTREHPASSLAESLERMSITVPNHDRQPPTAHAPSTLPNQTLRKPPSTSSLKAHSPDPLRRRSEGPRSPAQRASPSQSRRQSGFHDNQQSQHTPTKPNFRRTSSMTNSPRATSHPAFSIAIPEDETPPITAASVASDHFQRELDLHKDSSYISPDTLVIIHDACYGHRYSRPKTTKTNLGLIVERPERIQAGITGVASAYVRLGGRHSDADNAPHPSRQPNKIVPFGIRKSSRFVPLTAPVVTSVHGTKWMQELTVMCNSAGEKLSTGSKELTRPDTPGGGLSKPKLHEGDLYLCRESLDALQGALGGVLDAVDAVFQGIPDGLGTSPVPSDPKRAFVCVRPPGHHCSADLPSGFCWLNNVHVGIEHAAQIYGLTHAAIIDFDLHHGDGSQAITWERNTKAAKAPKTAPQSKKSSVGYFSLHDINSYPCEYGDLEKVQSASLCLENAHNQTIWNVHLQPWKSEADFWKLYEDRYSILLEKARSYLKTQTSRLRANSPNLQPKSAIFISAGFDASEYEGEGMQRHKVNVPTEFYARFTQDIVRIAEEDGTSAGGRVISVLEGGYSDRALMSGVMSHLSGLTTPLASPSAVVDGNGAMLISKWSIDKRWWDIETLQELELLLNPKAPLVPKKTKVSELSTFASPTESFTAKVVDPSRVYRSLSGVASVPDLTRAPTPLPDVGWATAAHELSKLLIPRDRQVNSCRHEDLNEPKPKPKRDRHSTIGLSAETTAEKMQTRGRKAKVPSYTIAETSNGDGLPLRKASDSDRRRTISDLPMSDDPEPNQSERPTTSDSKAHSEGSVIAPDASGPSSRNVSPSKATKEAAKVHRTRRASGAKTDLMQKDVNVKPPPVPRLPTKYGQSTTGPPGFKREGTADSHGSTDMDRLANGVKKITLKMPSKPSQSSTVSSMTAPPKKPERKPVVPRTTMAKPPVPKNVRSSTAKTLKTGDTTTNGLVAQAIDVANVKVGKAEDSTGAISDATPAEPVDLSLAAPYVSLEITKNSAGANAVVEPQLSGVKSTTPLTVSEREDIQRSIAQPLAPETVEAMQPSNDLMPQERASAPETSREAASSEFIAYNPSSDFSSAQSSITTQHTVAQGPLKWLPPNTNTPAQTPDKRKEPKKLDAVLPVFSPTGTIPFATGQHTTSGPADAASSHEEKQEETQAGRTIWDVPVTPRN